MRRHMPEKETVEKAKRKLRAGKSPTTAAGEFVREELHHVREGKLGARSAKQAIAIGLSKARRAGVKLGSPKNASSDVRKRAARDSAKGRSHSTPSPARSRATLSALKREGRAAASHLAISRQAKQTARKRSAASRSRSAQKGARTRARGAK